MDPVSKVNFSKNTLNFKPPESKYLPIINFLLNLKSIVATPIIKNTMAHDQQRDILQVLSSTNVFKNKEQKQQIIDLVKNLNLKSIQENNLLIKNIQSAQNPFAIHKANITSPSGAVHFENLERSLKR